MGKPIKLDEAGDSDDLQALFDSIAAASPPPAEPPPVERADTTGDSDELQALFDSMTESSTPAASAPPAGLDGDPQDVVFNRIGHLARKLHDSLRELGVDRMLEDAARQMPDAQQRLQYIAQMTEQAASRVLNATDIAKPIQDNLIARSEAMAARWDKMFANQLSVDEFKQLAADTRGYFQEAPGQMRRTNEQLTEIMLAQDFQDLTGQVIKKVVEMVQGMEANLLALLIETMPAEKKAEIPSGLMNGPVIDATGRVDVVTNQAQVDDLLESLGF